MPLKIMCRIHLQNQHPEYLCHKGNNCGLGLNSKMAFVVHKNNKHPIRDSENQYICSECSKPFKHKPTLLTHVRVDHFKFLPLSCSKCPLQFDTQTRLSSHFKIHATELKFNCDKCETKFTTSSNLWYHRKHVHDIASFVCEHCAKAFKFKTQLDDHLKSKHGEKTQTFVCEECGKVHNNEKSAKDHSRLHRNEGTFECPYEGCDRIFKRKDLMRIHFKSAHTILEKKYPCGYCNLKFRLPSVAKRHEEKIHLGTKDLKCNLCDYKTKHPSNLSVHKKAIHEGVTYSCDYPGCCKSYNRKDNLDAHRKTAHKIPRPTDTTHYTTTLKPKSEFILP